jgi:hypothetical protein
VESCRANVSLARFIEDHGLGLLLLARVFRSAAPCSPIGMHITASTETCAMTVLGHGWRIIGPLSSPGQLMLRYRNLHAPSCHAGLRC